MKYRAIMTKGGSVKIVNYIPQACAYYYGPLLKLAYPLGR